jgi:hypothetical protein
MADSVLVLLIYKAFLCDVFSQHIPFTLYYTTLQTPHIFHVHRAQAHISAVSNVVAHLYDLCSIVHMRYDIKIGQRMPKS